MRPQTAFIIVSQSQTLARGVCEVVATLAPEVIVEPCGCHDEGLGTASQIVTTQVSAVMEKMSEQGAIVLMADFGAARLACQQVITDLGERSLRLGRGPLIEGTAAGAVAAAQGADLAEVLRSISAAAQFFPEEDAADILPPAPAVDPLAPRTVVYGGTEPLSARPAARLARIATGFDAQVTINDVDAGSVLALMGLKVHPGQELRIAAEGGESRRALDAVEAELSDSNAPWPEEIATDQMMEPEAVTQLREAAAQSPELPQKTAAEENNATSENMLPRPPAPINPLDPVGSNKIPAAPAASDTLAPAAESAELIKRIGVGPLPVSLEK